MKNHSTRLVFNRSTAVTLVLGSGMALTACGSSTGSSTTGSSNATGASKVPSSALVQSGKLTLCADISAPPLTFYNSAQQPTGAEVDLGDAIAKNLGLTADWKNVAFSGIIPALQGKQCDAIMSQLYIKPAREKVVDFVPYMFAGNTVMVKAGNPDGIKGLIDLCNRKVAVQTGTTITGILQAENSKCTTAGKKNIQIVSFGRDSEAQQQLKLGLVSAYGTTVETAGYALKQQSGVFDIVGKPIGQVKTGIATLKSNTVLHDALKTAFQTTRTDGTYARILKQWFLTGDSLPSS